MTVGEFITSLREQDVRVWLEGERLRVSAPDGRLTPELKRELSVRKAEIQAYLESLELPRVDVSVRPVAVVVDGIDHSVGEFPASFAQRRLWFIERLEPGDLAYIVAGSTQINGAIDAQVLEDSIADVVRRQGALRTVFREVDGEPVQVVRAGVAVELRLIDLTGLPERERIDTLQRLKKQDAATPFDLEAGPLLRVMLVTQDVDRHTFLFCMHHIICDGWSLAILLQDILAHYEARTRGEVYKTPLTAHYGQYAKRQRESLDGPELEQLLGYWRGRLAGAPAVLELPTDRSRPAKRSFEGATHVFRFSRELTAGLRALARRENVTMYMMLLALFKILLYRLSGQSDVVVGTAVTTRDSPELEGVIGLFVSTLAIRSDLSADPSVRDFLRATRENVLEAQAHRDLPFEKLVEVLRPARTAAWSPIFQVAFALQNTPAASAFDVTSAAAMYDITLYVWDDQAEIRGSFEYCTALFDAETIARMTEHLRVLAENVVRDAEVSVSRVQVLSEDQLRQLLAWSSSPSPYPRDATVPELFDAVAETHAEAVAVEGIEPSYEPLSIRRLTYRELAEASQRLAVRLQDEGVGSGERVGLYLERSVSALVTMLAVLRIGAVYVPLDPANPIARTRELLRTANARLVVAPAGAAKKLRETGARVLAIERLQRSARSPPGLSDSEVPGPEGEAYVMFTSGTTGVPKGVRVTHRNIVRLVRNTNYVSIGHDDTLLQFAPLAFDASTFEIWGALLNGARLVVYPAGTPSAHELARALKDYRVTTLWLTAGLFHVMVDAERQVLADVRQVLAGGDVLSVPHVQALLDAKREGVVVNGYGPTENTTFTCCHPMRPGAKLGESVPIGRPVANTTAYVVDAHDQPVAIGVAGELVTGGDGVARGYLGASEADASRFTLDPFDSQAGALLYRTGDRVRWRADGTLDFLGRQDRQIKVRGFRVELGEIEDTLRACDQVRDVAVISRKDSTGTSEVIAYVVPRVGEALDKVAIRLHLGERLPAYMMPADIVGVAALPLTANGKLDRAALPTPSLAVEKRVDPRTLMETQLLAIWENVLGYSEFGVRDNFFDLGGHSLLALRIFAQVERVFGRRLAVSVLFQAPTIEQLAARLTQEGFASEWNSLVAIQPEGAKPPLFMVPGIGGNVLLYAQFARVLGREQPLYGLQSAGLDGREAPLGRVEEIAAHYIKEIRRLRPHGPYSLGGACFGGAVAYEMAQQLRSESEEVDFLLLVETWPPPPRRPIIDAIRRRLHHVRFLGDAAQRHLTQIVHLSPRLFVGALYNGAKIIAQMIAHRDVYRGEAAAMYVDRVSTANVTAFSRYRPQPYDGDVHLVLASARSLRSTNDPRLYWGHLAHGYHHYHVAARDSGQILKSPHVEQLTDWVREALQTARTKVGKNGLDAAAKHPSLAAVALSFMTFF